MDLSVYIPQTIRNLSMLECNTPFLDKKNSPPSFSALFAFIPSRYSSTCISFLGLHTIEGSQIVFSSFACATSISRFNSSIYFPSFPVPTLLFQVIVLYFETCLITLKKGYCYFSRPTYSSFSSLQHVFLAFRNDDKTHLRSCRD